jgi:hypothetical protein
LLCLSSSYLVAPADFSESFWNYNVNVNLDEDYNKMTKLIQIFLSVATVTIISLPLSAKAEKVCQVTDPTGTPLNVRSSPNGRITNTLRNGREVYIQKIETDEKGRLWALIGGYYQGQYKVWGWVFREFISCYNR